MILLRRPESCSREYNGVVTPSKHVRKVAEADFPTRWGQFRIYGFEGYFPAPANGGSERRKETAVALVMGDIHAQPPLVRIHSQCLTGDVFGSLRCDCRQQLEMALSLIAQAGCGVLVYEQQHRLALRIAQSYAGEREIVDKITTGSRTKAGPGSKT